MGIDISKNDGEKNLNHAELINTYKNRPYVYVRFLST
jgi:hypothetical protein